MDVTATDAKNRLGQMLDHCQREPVIIEKQGRRHSVLISAARYDELMAAQRRGPASADPGGDFYRKYKHWVDETNAEVEQQGLWSDGLRVW